MDKSRLVQQDTPLYRVSVSLLTLDRIHITKIMKWSKSESTFSHPLRFGSDRRRPIDELNNHMFVSAGVGEYVFDSYCTEEHLNTVKQAAIDFFDNRILWGVLW